METPGTDLPELSENEGFETLHEDLCTENHTFNLTALSPRPLDPKKGRHTYENHQAQCPTNFKSGLTSSFEGLGYDPPQNYQRVTDSNRDADRDRKNKPLPLEPDHPGLVPQAESTPRNHRIDEAFALPSSKENRYSMSIYSTRGQYLTENDQRFAVTPNPVSNLVASEHYGPFDHRCNSSLLALPHKKKNNLRNPSQTKKPRCRLRRIRNVAHKEDQNQNRKRLLHALKNERCKHVGSSKKGQTDGSSTLCPILYCQPSSLARMNKFHERKLLHAFFGFDLSSDLHPFNDARLQQIKHFLTAQPHPDAMINEATDPIVCCVWLRNFIVASPHKLDFDRGRLRGLRLEDKSTQNVHQGIGLLWGFLKACGPSVTGDDDSREEKSTEAQLEWFRVRTVSPGLFSYPLSVSLEAS